MLVEWQSAAQSREWPVWAFPHGEDAEPQFLWGTRPRLPRVSGTHVMASGPAFPLWEPGQQPRFWRGRDPPSLLWSRQGPPGYRETRLDVSPRPCQDGLIRLALLTCYNLSPRLPEGLLPTRHCSRELCLGSSPSHSPWESVYTV